MAPKNKNSPPKTVCDFSKLPPELLVKLFRFLDLYDLQAARLTCKHWYSISKMPEFDMKGVYYIRIGMLNDRHEGVKMLMNRQIERLHLYNVKVQSDAAFIFQHLAPTLKELTLRTVPFAIPIQLTEKYLSNLQKLTVTEIHSDGFSKTDLIPRNGLPGLKELILIYNDPAVNICLLGCMKKNKVLERLTLDDLNVEWDLLDVIQMHAQTIKYLTVGYYMTTELNQSDWKNAVADLNLIELQLMGHFNQPIASTIVMNQKDLRVLEVSGCGEISDEFLAIIGEKCLDLEELKLTFCARITDDGLSNMKKLNRLKVLNVTYCHKIRTFPFYQRDVFQELYLRDTPIKQKFVCIIAEKLPNLKVLDLGSCSTAVTANSLQKIYTNLLNLEKLYLDNCNLSEDDFLGLPNGTSILNLKKLQHLSLYGCNLLTDKSLEVIRKLPFLKMLDITYCDMTDNGLELMANECNVIQELHLAIINDITKQGILILFDYMRRLRLLRIFDYENANTKLVRPDWGREDYRIYVDFSRLPVY